MEESGPAFSHGLEAVGGVVVQKLEGGGQAADAQEKSGIGHGAQRLGIVLPAGMEKNPHRGPGDDLEKHHAGQADEQARLPGGADGLLHPGPVGKLVNDRRVGPLGARQRLVEEDQGSDPRRNPGADPGRTQGAAGQKQVLQVFIHSIILSSADAEKRPGSSMGLFTTAQSASVYS